MTAVARRVPVVLLGWALVVACGLAAIGSLTVSDSEVVHKFESSFDETPTGPLGEGLGTIAIDQANGYVYVGDRSANGDVVYKLNLAGEYLSQVLVSGLEERSGVAVDNSGGPNKGDLYAVSTSEAGVVYRFDSSGKLLSEIDGSECSSGRLFYPSGATVDASGNLYVVDSGGGAVDEFDPSGHCVRSLVNAFGAPSAVAVDMSGNVYVAAFGGPTVKIASGGGESILDANHTYALDTDPVSGHVLVGEREYPSPGKIAEYDSSGKRLGEFGEQRFGYVSGIAVRAATGQIYISDRSGGVVDIFSSGIVIPDVSTEAPSNVQPKSVRFNGMVNPDGLPVTACEFEYGTSESYGTRIPCEQSPSSIGSATTPVQVGVSVGGLQPDTVYHYRLVASNKNGAKTGADVMFTTTGPPRIDGESASEITRTTVTLGAPINPSGFNTTYHFEYGATPSYGTNVPVPNTAIGAGIEDVAVSQPIGSLTSGVTYHYRAIAVSECEPGKTCTIAGADQVFTTVPPASIDAQYSTSVTADSATLNAQVNPIDTSSEYRFEYGTGTSYDHVVTGSIGEANSDVPIGVHVQELQPGTTYHYRIVVSNGFGTVEGADHTFVTPSAGNTEPALPDGRAWELVSPPRKHGVIGSSLRSYPDLLQAANDGSRITYATLGPVGEGALGSTIPDQALSRHGPFGWGTQDITLPNELPLEGGERPGFGTGQAGFYVLFSPDLSLAALWPSTSAPSLSSPASECAPYLLDSATSIFMPILKTEDVPAGTKLCTLGDNGREGGGRELLSINAATPDLSHFVLRSPAVALTSEPWTPFYELTRGGRPKPIGVLPKGGFAATPFLAGESGPGLDAVPRAMSADGQWIAWTDNSPYEGVRTQAAPLYVRDMIAEKTIQLGNNVHVFFQDMNSDGSKLFFLENGDLFEYQTAIGSTTDLTASHEAGETSAGVQELVSDVSEDGSYVYFVANGVLTSTANARGEMATPGHCIDEGVEGSVLPGATCNLYLLHDVGGVWNILFIATLSQDDEHTWWQKGSNGAPELSAVFSRVSGDGRFFAFMSDRPLTGYDNVDTVSGQPDEEVYLYDAVLNRLVCVSCDSTGARPAGVFDSSASKLLVDEAEVWNGHWLAGSVPGWNHGVGLRSLYQPRYLSNDGRLFFDSPDALVPQATNGLNDVYEYEPVPAADAKALSSDTCASSSPTFSERTGGCVSLVSSGVSSSESAFMDASENGDDVFFLTAQSLVPEDFDTASDIYDAHVCSASVPCHVVPARPPECSSGDACKAAPSPQPVIFGAPASATFSGAGNVATSNPDAGESVKSRGLTRAQRLARALSVCRKVRSKEKRAACKRRARKRYGAGRAGMVSSSRRSA